MIPTPLSQQPALAVRPAPDATPGIATSPAGAPRVEPLLAQLAAGDRGLADLAAALDLSLADLARLALQPDTVVMLESLRRLDEARIALAIGRYRLVAAAVLTRIAAQQDKDDQYSDLSRKACVDLLNADTRPSPPAPPSARRGASPASDTPLASGDSTSTSTSTSTGHGGVATAEAILQAFDRLEQEEANALAALRV